VNKLAAFALLAAGCVQGNETESRRLAFAPAPELAEAASLAVARITAASGIVLSISESGIPIVNSWAWVPDKPGGKKHRVCGATPIMFYADTGIVDSVSAISVDAGWSSECSSVEHIVLHEMIHAIVNVPGLQIVNEHAASGVFYPDSAGSDLLNADSLELLCSHVSCSKFEPEEEPSESF
jgi:hypothetical protein